MKTVVVVLVVLLLAALAYALAAGSLGAVLSRKVKQDEAAGAPGQLSREDGTTP